MMGYRKVFVISLVISLTFVLALRNQLTGDFALVAGAAIGAYTTANVLAGRKESRGNPE